MYTQYFGLHTKPFELLPNSSILFPSKAHKRALTYLDYGIRSKAGFILLTGEVGSGKTTLIRNLLCRQSQDLVVSNVFNTRVSSEDLLRLISDDFSLPSEGKDRFTLLRGLNDFLIEQFAGNRQAVLVIDEAQNLTKQALEEIRLLSNLETDQVKLLQIILVGQPELRTLLSDPSLLQLRQRISVNCHLRPLSQEETSEYVFFRLEKAGNRQAVSLSSEALNQVHGASRGIPRLINILCDYILLDAFAMKTREIDAELVRMVVQEMSFETIYWSSSVTDVLSADHPLGGDLQEPETSREKLQAVPANLIQRIDGLERNLQDVSALRKRLEEVETNLGKLSETLRNGSEQAGGAFQALSQRPTLTTIQRSLQERLEPDEKHPAGRCRLFSAFFRG
ncbi:XrtA/PEP-CTERM system-associated ATPase [Desulfocurvibacter africanus]|uniref:XrtA/PEP-CTERM system-associated ATPase n=1 Tax=Desulfocurvibacter africanus TaxID=873 RepID=UPI0003FC5912|nr:XrtA/PEP-CTERM system-associated ATPase [Desulfocurvibacter africanus]